MRFLIDECLSVDLVTIAAQAGYEAYHVARVGKAGWVGYRRDTSIPAWLDGILLSGPLSALPPEGKVAR